MSIVEHADTTGDGLPELQDSAQLPFAREMLSLIRRELVPLEDKPEEAPAPTLAALWHLAAGSRFSLSRAASRPLPALDDAAKARLRSAVAERLSGVPLAHLTERQDFMGLELLAGPQALIPRRETELLARAAIDAVRQTCPGDALIVDVCTGSGNVALALANALPRARVHCADLSREAVELARANAAFCGLDGRVRVVDGDLLAPFDTDEFHGRVDLLTCNPPYISTAKVATMPGEIAGYEPRLAFDGGPIGVSIVQRLVREAPRLLRPGGTLAFEVGLGQAAAIARRLERAAEYSSVKALSDAAGHGRVVVATRADT